MNKSDIKQKLKMLNFPKDEYWVVAGSAMVLYGIKEETHDIDLGCSSVLANRLEANGYPAKRLADGSRRFAIGNDIEIFERWLFDRVTFVDGVPTISLKGLLLMKESLGREKDRADIRAIRAFLEKQK